MSKKCHVWTFLVWAILRQPHIVNLNGKICLKRNKILLFCKRTLLWVSCHVKLIIIYVRKKKICFDRKEGKHATQWGLLDLLQIVVVNCLKKRRPLKWESKRVERVSLKMGMNAKIKRMCAHAFVRWNLRFEPQTFNNQNSPKWQKKKHDRVFITKQTFWNHGNNNVSLIWHPSSDKKKTNTVNKHSKIRFKNMDKTLYQHLFWFHLTISTWSFIRKWSDLSNELHVRQIILNEKCNVIVDHQAQVCCNTEAYTRKANLRHACVYVQVTIRLSIIFAFWALTFSVFS